MSINFNLNSCVWLVAAILDCTHLVRFWKLRYFLRTKCDKWDLEISVETLSYFQVLEDKGNVLEQLTFNHFLRLISFHLLCNCKWTEMALTCLKLFGVRVLYQPRLIHWLLNHPNMSSLNLPYWERSGKVAS